MIHHAIFQIDSYSFAAGDFAGRVLKRADFLPVGSKVRAKLSFQAAFADNRCLLKSALLKLRQQKQPLDVQNPA